MIPLYTIAGLLRKVPQASTGVGGPLTIEHIFSMDDTPGASTSGGSTAWVFDTALPTGTIVFLVTNFRGIGPFLVDGVPLVQIGSTFTSEAIECGAFVYNNVLAETKTISVGGTISSVERFVSAFKVTGAVAFDAVQDVPLAHQGGVLYQSVSANAASHIPIGGLTEHYNGDIRSGEMTYVGSAQGDLTLTAPGGSIPHSSIAVTIDAE